jgi:hypothetical protein
VPRREVAQQGSSASRALRKVAAVELCAVLGVVCAGCDDVGRELAPPPAASSNAVSVEARSGYWPTYPCTQCHEHRPGTANLEERKLTEFHARTNDLAHGDLEGWCYRCHDRSNVDRLLLPDGRSVSFDRGHDHCGGCHGEKLRDWQIGIHGLTTGHWSGPQLRRSCTHCHDPHQPKFPSLEARPLAPNRKASTMPTEEPP